MEIRENTPIAAAMREIGARLRKTRVARQMTQSEVAVKAGISTPSLSHMENGDIRSMQHFLSVLKVLGQFSNLDVMLPDEDLSPAEAYRKTTERQRVRKTPSTDFRWGDSE